MANLEVLALDPAVPQIRAPGTGDGYSVPRDMTFAGGTTLTAPTVNATTVDATNVEVTNVKAKDGTAAITIADSTGDVGLSANLTFSSTGQRITGDMSNATESNRLAFQTSTTNGSTRVNILTNGTGTASSLDVFGVSDPTNAAVMRIRQSGSESQVLASITGTGTYLPMTFYTGGSERMRLDTSGNLGIGTASPSTWGKFAVSGGGNAGVANFIGNASLTGSNPTYTGSIRLIDNPTSSTSASGGFEFLTSTFGSGYGWKIAAIDSSGVQLTFATRQNSASWTEAMRIDSSGNVGIGGTAAAFVKVNALGTLPTSSNLTASYYADGTIPSGTTTAYYGYRSLPSTQAAAFTITNFFHHDAAQGTFGAGSAVTNQYGFHADSNLTGATNNYGFFSNIASGSNRWNFYAAGTAQNYFAGDTTFGTTSTNPVGGNVVGAVIAANGTLGITRDSEAALLVNRKTNDGDLVQFFQDGTLEGSISVSGNTISYNPFMGSHYTEIVGAMPTLKGTVLESLDELVRGRYSNQDRLPKAKVSDTVGSSAVYGVYFAPDSDPDTNDGILAAALGASWVRIAAGVTVQRGDLLESNGDGCAKVQSDDIIRSKTIGKVTSTTVADTYQDGSYIVPCVLYCG